YWLLIWYLGGLGVIVLGRHLRGPRWGCFAVAATFVCCGVYTGHAEHTDTLYAFSALAWVIWGAGIAIPRGGVVNDAQGGGAGGGAARAVVVGWVSGAGHWECELRHAVDARAWPDGRLATAARGAAAARRAGAGAAVAVDDAADGDDRRDHRGGDVCAVHHR